MTKNQEITTRQLIETATEIKNAKGYRSIDFIPNAYSVMENIVLTWERGEHTSANFKKFKRDMAAFIEALRADKLETLQLDTFDKHGRALWAVVLSVSTDWGLVGDFQKKALRLDDAVYSLLDSCPEFTRLLIENKGDLEEFDLLESGALPRLARSGESGRYESIDNLKKALCLLNFKYHAVTALAGMGEHDFLKIHTFRKEVR